MFMVRSTNQKGELLDLVDELLEIFSDTYAEKEKLGKLVKNTQYAKDLFVKLRNVLDQYDKRGANIVKKFEFAKQLRHFKQMIEGNIHKSTQYNDVISSLDGYLSVIKESYRINRDNIETLEEINTKIGKILRMQENKNKIGGLISRGVQKKTLKLIYFDLMESNPERRKLRVVKIFYGYFVRYISFIRKSAEDLVDVNRYACRLEDMQLKLLSEEPIDIKDYFFEIKHELTHDPGYSVEILLRCLAENPLIHTSISNDSRFYLTNFIKIFEKLVKSKMSCASKTFIESISILIYQLDRAHFGKLYKAISKENAIIKLVFKIIYDKGVELYISYKEHISTTNVNQKDPSQSTISENIKELKAKFSDFFELILSRKTVLLDQLRDSVIEEKNANGTFCLLSDIYDQPIQNLNLEAPDDIINVKYCFNYCMLQSLKYQDLGNVPRPELFHRLLFYIQAHDSKQSSKDTDKKHKKDLFKLKAKFYEVQQDNYNDLESLIEILKMMINIQTYSFRLTIGTSILSQLKDKSKNENFNVKIETLKPFFDETGNEKEVCFRLAKSFNIHLLKDVFEDQNLILEILCNCNPNFKLMFDSGNEFNNKFDIDKDLTPGCSIPYYLSVKLTDDERYNDQSPNYDESNFQIVMSVLFKVFNCSSNNDKQQFFNSKDELNKEFIDLFESVNRLIQFYNLDDHEEICQQLLDISIGHILDGFSRGNEESLIDRNKYARKIVDNAINYKFEYVIKVFESTRSADEVVTIFNIMLERKNHYSLDDWARNTSYLHEKLHFLFCYHKYSRNDFDRWFKELNPHISNTTYETIENNRVLVENEFKKNIEAFNQLDIKYLQHNQVGALALIYDLLEDPSKNNDNIFMKVSTGQGKSLIIAETARKIIQISRNSHKKRQQIFIITCYDHLAKRDFENYQSYYTYFNIRSMYCSRNSSTKDFSNQDVIYADLETYFNVLRNDGYNTLMGSGTIDLPDISDAVLIMDEFDSLILDSDEILQVTYRFKLENYNKTQSLDQKENFRKLFDKIFSKGAEQKFGAVIDRWHKRLLHEKKEEDKKNKKRGFQDTLGREHTFASSILTDLSKGSRACFVHFYLYPLAFYRKFKQVIGFSGSITSSGMNKFNTLFGDKKCLYYEIPRFFGLSNFQKNWTFKNAPGVVKENTDDYLKAILEEIMTRHSEQPILIFADSVKNQNQTKSDFEYIHEQIIEAKGTFLKDSKIIKVEKEEDIKENIDEIGKLGSITLATRILSRGADIKVDKNIENGLHLILTYYPERENIYIQMLGRTARQDEKGSYSEITRSPKSFTDGAEVKVNSTKKIWHDVTEYFYKNVTRSSTKKNLDIKWVLFSCLMQELDENDRDEDDLIDFVKANILNLQCSTDSTDSQVFF